MKTHGTPLTDTDMVELAGAMMIAAARSGVVKDRETMQHWKNRIGDLAILFRETMVRPGRRVLEIDRSISVRSNRSGEEASSQDKRAAAVVEVDLSLVRFIPRKDVSKSRHILLDAHVAHRFRERYEDLPPSWKESREEIFFIGSEFQDNEYTWYPTMRFHPNYGRGSEGYVSTSFPMSHEKEDILVAVLLID